MDYFSGDYVEFSSSEKVNLGSNFITGAAHFPVDDLLDFSTEDETMTDAFLNSSVGNSGNSSTVAAVESRHSSNSGGVDGKFDGNVSCNSFNWTQFSGNELCIPYDDIAELEWLSNFVEESFSTDDLHFLPVATTATATSSSSAAATTAMNRLPPPSQFLPIDSSVPAKARSKRSRAAPHDWSSRLLVLPLKAAGATDRTGGRKCLHCASEKTPQWRTGPMGPKTLCNACRVRFKSGRLVSEYRPAASPTFISTEHSNSHRKVLELRRQKELQLQVQRAYAHQQPLIGGCEEILVHHRSRINGPDFRHV